MGRKPIHTKAMTPAQRQRRYRKRLKQAATGIDKRQRRAEREPAIAEAIRGAAGRLTMFARLYGVLYVDPPWRFEPRSRLTGMDRAADNHYPTMTLDEIKALKIPAAKNCILFLWSTVPMMSHAHDVMRTWGFEYQSLWTWEKVGPDDDELRLGTGYWLRNGSEHVLIGTRGSVPCPVMGDNPPSVIRAPRGGHSEKPAAFAEWIERMFPTVPKLEMFARGAARPGWDAWGAESAD